MAVGESRWMCIRMRLLLVWRGAQHRIGWHQWQTLQPAGAAKHWERCTWCGANKVAA